MAKKIFTVRVTRRGRISNTSGTISELVKHFGYTLECGKSWEHESGNSKINLNPRGIKSLVKNLNNADNNSAQNGCGMNYYEEGFIPFSV